MYRNSIQQKTLFDNIATYCMMIALFFNPFGFDIIQYWLILATGSLWGANFVLYCIAGIFFLLSIYFRRRYSQIKNT